MNGAAERRANRRGCARSRLSGAGASLIIIVIGLGMLLDNLGIIRGRDIWDYAPALLIAFGLSKVLDSRGRPGKLIFGGLMAVIGTVWLLDNLDFIHFNSAMVVPLVFIGVGVSMLIRALGRESQGGINASAHIDDDSQFWQWSLFGGVRRVIRGPEFRGGEALSVFSGITLDLRQATITGDKAVIEANAVFGGIDMKVPKEWAVQVRGVGIFGGYDDKSSHPDSGPELVVTGTAVFGGVSITN